MIIAQSGNVGIGTTSPSYSLEVKQASTSPGINIAPTMNQRATIGFGLNSGLTAGWVLGQDRNANGTRDLYLYDVGNSRDVMYWNTGGNVGIGTTNPNFNLDVNRGGTAADVFLGIDANGSNNYSPVLYFRNTGTAISKVMTSRDLQFQNTNNTPLLYLKTNGNFGIGTTNPQFPLDVNGNINSNATITGNNIVAKYQDVAEWVPSSEQLRPGTVVVLDSTKSNQVISSTRGYDTRVAGVVSAQPGISLGEKSDDKVLVATTGRVRVKVDASRGAIQIGDLLVTSDVPGVAMKSEPVNLGGVRIHRPGTIIGKALEPLAKGQGEILVLLSLQ